MFEKHRVTGNQGRNDRVHCRHVGVIPGRNHQHGAMRLAPNVAVKGGTVFDLDGSQPFFRQIGHHPGTLVHAPELAAIAHGPPHLPGQFFHDVVIHVTQPGDAVANPLNPVRKRQGGPVRLCVFCPGDGLPRGFEGKCCALHIHGTIDGRYALNGRTHSCVLRLLKPTFDFVIGNNTIKIFLLPLRTTHVVINHVVAHGFPQHV